MQETGREGSALRSPAAWLRLLLVVAAGTAADLASKQGAYFALAPKDGGGTWPAERVEAVQSWLPRLDLIWQPNPGMVFGLGAGKTAFFIIFTVLALGLLAWLFVDSRKGQAALHVLLACIVAGSLGNLYDRISFGYVRDFLRLNIHAAWAPWSGPDGYLWPYVFNVADVLITVGVVGLFVLWIAALVRQGRRKNEPSSAKA
jgi:lipoprotein signal peptidase